MAVLIDQFIDNLTRSRLMSADEVAAFRKYLPPEERDDVKRLAKELVLAKKLTKYQAEQIYQGKVRGLKLGDYTILSKIGAGGMGVVLKARHGRMDRLVAVKVLPPAAMKSPDSVKRFYREVKAAAR